jgi:hypothetical protein
MSHLLNPHNPLSKRANRHLMNLTLPPSQTAVDRSSKLNKPYDQDWHKKVQDEMINAKNIRLGSEIVGKLYNLCVKLSELYEEFENDKGKKVQVVCGYNLYNEDSIAFGKAYKDAMVSKKSLVELPDIRQADMTSL